VAAWSLALRVMVNFVELTIVGVWATPWYVTVEVEAKFVPLMVRVWAAAPAVDEAGDRLVIAGTRVFTVTLADLFFVGSAELATKMTAGLGLGTSTGGAV
jgi:hypothetical protein